MADIENTNADIENLRNVCFSKGPGSLKWLAVIFRKMDDDFSGKLNFDEFEKGLNILGISLNQKKSRRLFNHIDRDHSGTIDFAEFVHLLRPPLTAGRARIINEVFDHLDQNKNGILEADDIKATYSNYAKQHPRYVNGEWSEDEVIREFLSTFDSPEGEGADGIVTRDEWMDYYSGVSVLYPDESYFNLMMRKCWQLPENPHYYDRLSENQIHDSNERQMEKLSLSLTSTSNEGRNKDKEEGRHQQETSSASKQKDARLKSSNSNNTSSICRSKKATRKSASSYEAEFGGSSSSRKKGQRLSKVNSFETNRSSLKKIYTPIRQMAINSKKR